MQLPREPRAGNPIDGAWGQQIIRYLRAITPRSGGGIRVKETAGGTIFETSNLDGASGSGVTTEHPFKVSDATSGGTAGIRVRFGQVKSVTPTIGTDALIADPAPVLTLTNGTWVIYLQVNLDVDGQVDTAEIAAAATKPADTADEGYLTLAVVKVASNAVTQINQSVTHSLGHQKCGTTVHNFWGL